MNEQETGVYLTERLRRSQPEYYDQELARGKKRAQRVGFILGSLVALAAVALATFLFAIIAPESLESLFLGIQ